MRLLLAPLLAVLPLFFGLVLWRYGNRQARFARRPFVITAFAGSLAGGLAAWLEPVVLEWTELSFSAAEVGSGALAATMLLAAPLEEALKVLVVWPWYIRHRIVSGRFGALLGLAAGAGFAAGEVLTTGLAVEADGIWALRHAVGFPAHLLFAVIWGFALGTGSGGRDRWFSLAWTASVLLHGMYDTLCFSRGPGMLWVNLPFLALLCGAVWLVLRAPVNQDDAETVSTVASLPSLEQVSKAMAKPDRPLLLRLVLLGALVTLGALIASLALGVYLGHTIGIDFTLADETDLRSSVPFVFLGSAMLLAFPVSGYLVARAGAADSVLEPALGAGLAITGVLIMVGLTEPMALVAAVLVAPVAFALACGGAWFALERY